jgi:hypothetical protein
MQTLLCQRRLGLRILYHRLHSWVLHRLPSYLLDLLQKSKTHPPQSPRGFGGKQEKLDSLPEVAGRVGEGSGAFLQEVYC